MRGLPRATQLWIGGADVRKAAPLDGMLVLPTLAAAVAGWRER